MDFGNWLLFASIAFVATISPGPAILLVTSHSLAYGLQRCVPTMLGNITGLFVMSALSVAGLSAIILHSAPVFTLVKWIGALYLVYLGIRLITRGFGCNAPGVDGQRTPGPAPAFRQRYGQGLLVALSNPKAIAFTTALFPQFVDQSAPILPQFGMLVATFMLLSFCCLFGYAALFAGARSRAVGGGWGATSSKVFGVVFILSGGLLAGTSANRA